MNRISLYLAGAALVFFACFSPCIGMSKKIVAEGVSETSFDAASRDALRNAVEEGAGTFIHSETEMKNFAVKKDRIFTRAEGYVLGMEILEKRQEDQLYHVRIEAEISLDKVKSDLVALKILLETMDRPKLMILIEEDYSGLGFQGMKLAETEMTALFEKKGFELIDKTQFEIANEKEQEAKIFAGNLDAGKTLGLRFGAQYLLIGKAVVQKTEGAVPDSDFHSLHASLQLKILHCGSGAILGSVVKNAVRAHINPLAGATEALRLVSKKAVEEYAAEKIMDSFQDYLNNGLPLAIHIVGIKDFQLYREVMACIEKVEGIVHCKKQGWNKTGGLLVLDARYRGTSEDLARVLDRKSVGKGKLSVEDFAPEKLDLAYQ